MGPPGLFFVAKGLMRLGIVTSSFSLGPDDTTNAGVFVRDLAGALSVLGQEVHVLTPRKAVKPSQQEPFTVYPFYWWGTFQDLASASPRNPLRLIQFASLLLNGMFTVARYARKKRLEALLAMWAIPSGLFCLRPSTRLGIPYGVWALGSDIWGRKKYPGGDFLVRRVLQRAAFRFADGIKLAEEVEGLAGAPCAFVPSIRRLQPAGALKKPDLDFALTQFLFIGRYEKNKGPDILVRAMTRLLQSGVTAQLHLFGGGSLESGLRQLTQGFEKFIRVNGYADQETVMRFMRYCHWLVIPSRIESVPLIFMDALQMRIPMIGTDVGDLGRLIQMNQVGWVVASPDPEALVQVLREAVLRPPPRDSWKWEESLKQFDLETIARKCLLAFSPFERRRS
jgi:glycosyltransferase involved in cell wall biosynthesis